MITEEKYKIIIAIIKSIQDALTENKQAVVTGESVGEYSELIIEALEKRMPKKPILDAAFPSGIKWFNCPECSHIQQIPECDFCPNCGQALDWSDEV